MQLFIDSLNAVYMVWMKTDFQQRDKQQGCYKDISKKILFQRNKQQSFVTKRLASKFW